jgi:DNA-binding NtrC family response regulator
VNALKAGQLHLIALSADATIRHVVESFEGSEEWRIDVVEEPGALFSRLTHETAMVLIDEPAVTGGYLSAIRRARRTVPGVDVLVVGGPKSDELIASERREGVDQYFARPLDEDFLQGALSHRMKLVALKQRAGIVGRSPGMEELLEAVLQVAPTEVPILIEGESGTGKDVVAHAIHMASLRADKSFEAINCGSLAEGVLESELFGHEKGAFTGAVARRAGMFERADGGTIFLDEVGETSATMQVRLLRVLESGDVLRVGGVQGFRVDVRVIAATNRKLSQAVRKGTFRQDLYYRLKGISLYLPPLRERPEDLPILAQHFIAVSNRQHHKSVRGIEPSGLARLAEHSWPGNIRELRNLIDTLVVLAPGTRITAAEIDAQLARESAVEGAEAPSLLPVPLGRSKEDAEREMIYAAILAMHRDVREILGALQGGTARPWDGMREVRPDDVVDEEPQLNLATLERQAIQEALGRHGGNRRRAAEELGISERTLYRKIKEYGLV